MPTAVITYPGVVARASAIGLESETGLRWTPPWWPEGTENSGYGMQWTEVERPEQFPLVDSNGVGLHRVTIGPIVVGYHDGRDIEADLSMMRRLAREGRRVRLVGWGRSHLGWWRMVPPTWNIVQSNELGDATVADVTVTLVRAVDVDLQPSPIAQVTAATPAPITTPGTVKEVTPPAIDLPSVAYRYLGDASRWPEIADLNSIRDPRSYVPGTALRVPS